MRVGAKVASAAVLLAASVVPAQSFHEPRDQIASVSRPGADRTLALQRAGWGHVLATVGEEGNGSPFLQTWTADGELISRGKAHGSTDSGEPEIIVITRYNDSAANHIRTNRFSDVAELQRLRRDARGIVREGGGHIAPFPVGSAIVLSAWWPVAHDTHTAMPVWDPELNPPLVAGNNYMTWRRVLRVSGPSTPSDRTVGGALADRAATRSVSPVALSRFRYVRLGGREASVLMADVRRRKAALIAIGRPLEAGDALALVGMHLAVKRPEGWNWVTLWWHDRPDQGPNAVARPRPAPTPWSNYLLDAQAADVTAAARRPCFNPWLEARFPDLGAGGGVQSDCVSCHRRAAFPSRGFLLPAESDRADAAPASGDRLETDSVWALARRGP